MQQFPPVLFRLHIKFPNSHQSCRLNYQALYRRQEKNYEGNMYYFWDGPPNPPPTPQTPLPMPPPGQKGYQSAPFTNRLPSAYSSRPEIDVLQSYGAKTRYGRPCTHDQPGTHNWLAQSHIASISSEFH